MTVADQLHAPLEDIATMACSGVSGCDVASVTMRVDGRPTTVAASGRIADAIDAAQYDTGDGPCLRALQSGKPVSADLTDEQQWSGLSRVAVDHGMRTALAVPLSQDDRLLGSLNLYGRSADGFDAEARATAAVLGRQAAAAIHYLELANDERQARLAEQRVAQELQRTLLPAVPRLPGVTCATRYLVAADAVQVGGDWYDAFPLPDGAIGVAVGDVMGHGISAAAAMGQLRSVLRSYAYEGISPSTVLDRLDRLVQGFDMAQLATALYGRLILDRAGAMLLFCNAGHLPPLVRLPDGTTTQLAGAASRLIGAPLEGPPPRSEAAAVLPVGATLLLYTDGLVERRGEDIDVGIDRLCGALAQDPPDGSLDTLCDRALDRMLDDGHDDDVAMLALRID